MTFQFLQAFWSILNNYALIDYSDSRGDREFVGRWTEMRREVGGKRTSLWYTVVWQDFNFNVININVGDDIPIRNSSEREVQSSSKLCTKFGVFQKYKNRVINLWKAQKSSFFELPKLIPIFVCYYIFLQDSICLSMLLTLPVCKIYCCQNPKILKIAKIGRN